MTNFVTTITPANVRSVLDGPSSQQLSDANISAQIARVQDILNDIADSLSTTQLSFDEAVQAFAAWLSYGAYTSAVGRQMGSIPDHTQWQMKHYRDVAQLYCQRIAKETFWLDPMEGKGDLIGLPPQSGQTRTEGYIQPN